MQSNAGAEDFNGQPLLYHLSVNLSVSITYYKYYKIGYTVDNDRLIYMLQDYQSLSHEMVGD